MSFEAKKLPVIILTHVYQQDMILPQYNTHSATYTTIYKNIE